ncbi:hypothetical protein Q8G71_37010, partial [Klebsiella pneumoniae]
MIHPALLSSSTVNSHKDQQFIPAQSCRLLSSTSVLNSPHPATETQQVMELLSAIPKKSPSTNHKYSTQ